MQGSEALEIVSSGAALVRIENDTMLQVAMQRPRDEKKVLDGALAELDLVPEDAEVAYYSLPYKERRQGGGYRIAKVEGPSIKAAMALARRWGNCSTTARITDDTDEAVVLDGVFLDLETNFRSSRPFRVAKSFKLRNGKVIPLQERRLDNAVQAGASKAMRNAIVGGLPAYLVNKYVAKAQFLTVGDLKKPAEPEKIEAVKKAFARYRVTEAQLEKYVDVPVADWKGREIADLRGLYNGLKDEQITVEEAFGQLDDDETGGGDGSGSGEPGRDPNAGGKAISEPQIKRLFARASAAGHEREAVVGWIHNRYQCRVEDLPKSVYEAVIARLDNTSALGSLDGDTLPPSPAGQKREDEVPFE